MIPELPYPDIGEAIDWLSAAFGFSLRIRIGNHRAQMNVGDGAIVLIEQDPANPNRTGSVMVRVENVKEHHVRARQHGVQITRPPADYPYGERQYSAVDFAGHRWTFSESIADVAPEEWGGTIGRL